MREDSEKKSSISPLGHGLYRLRQSIPERDIFMKLLTRGE
jgi:hypothetical protein